MSIVMDSIGSRGFDRGGGSIFTADLDQPSPAKHGRMAVVVGSGLDPDVGCWISPSVSSDSSSIGKNSDGEEDDGGKSSPDGRDSCENEVESPYKGPSEIMESLEEVLPISRGISKFYAGKSKSFTSLAEASSSTTASAKDMSKPDNPYSRRRRNLLIHRLWENKNRTCSSRRGRISKKPITMSSSKSSLALAMAAVTGSINDSSSSGTSPTTSGSPPRAVISILPPLHPQSKVCFGNHPPVRGGGLCAWRSYSVVDLPRCFPAAMGDR